MDPEPVSLTESPRSSLESPPTAEAVHIPSDERKTKDDPVPFVGEEQIARLAETDPSTADQVAAYQAAADHAAAKRAAEKQAAAEQAARDHAAAEKAEAERLAAEQAEAEKAEAERVAAAQAAAKQAEAERAAAIARLLNESTSVFQFASPVAALSYSLLGDWEAAEETAAATLVETFRSAAWASDAPPDIQRQAILPLAHNVVRDYLRRSALMQAPSPQRAPTVEATPKSKTPATPQAPQPAQPAGCPGPEAQEAPAPDAAPPPALHIDLLAEPHRSVVKLRLWCGATFDDLAGILGKPPQSAASLYRGALRLLKERAEELQVPLPTQGEQRGEAAAPCLVPSEANLLGEEGIALQNLLLPALPRPAGEADPALLARVARRVISASAVEAGTLRFLSGPVDILPCGSLLRNLARLKTGPFVDRHPGDRVFSGEILIAGPGASFLLQTSSGHAVLAAPGSIVALGPPSGKEAREGPVVLLQGTAFALAAPQAGSPLTVSFPGGTAWSESGAFLAVVLTPGSSRIEAFDGSLSIANRTACKTLEPSQAILVRGGTDSVLAPAKRNPSSAAWLEELICHPGFPPELQRPLCSAVDSVERLPVTPPGTPAQETKAPAPPPPKRPTARLRRNRVVVALLCCLPALALGGYLLWNKDSGRPALDWFDALSRARRRSLGIGETGAPALFAFHLRGGRPTRVSPAGLQFPSETGSPARLSEADFKHFRKRAFASIAVERNWPRLPEPLVQEFCESLRTGAAANLERIAPGFPRSLWEVLLSSMEPVASYAIAPAPSASVRGAASMHIVTIAHSAAGSLTYRVVVTREEESGNRFYIDLLASDWNTAPRASPTPP